MEYCSQLLANALNVPLGGAVSELVDREAGVAFFSAGTTPLWEGNALSCAYLLLTGLVRGYYIDSKGNDITKCFSCEGEFFATEGLRLNKAASFSIECLEPCRCIRLPYSLVRQAVELNPALRELTDRLYRSEVSRLEARSRDLLLMSATERYAAFQKAYPGFEERVPQKYIASYIGIRPQSLSRIRKETECPIHLCE